MHRQDTPRAHAISALRRRVHAGFLARFDRPPEAAAFAPGRVNLIGEHIDYCGGTVLPMPIQHGTWVAAARSDRDGVRAVSLDHGPAVELDPAEDPALPHGHWGRFVAGALAVSRAGERDPRAPGLDLCVAGDLPGSGLSSSASLSVALLQVIGWLRHGAAPQGLELARAAQRIEHEFVGVACGLMDQAAIVLGAKDSAVLFDCAGERYRQVPLDPALAIVIADSGVHRALAASGYNERRREVARIASLLSADASRLAPVLCEAPPGLGDVSALEDPVLRRRAAHVASEQARVHRAARALGERDHRSFGLLLNESHASLRDAFEVSCTELDLLAEAFAGQSGCHGARMTGGGFGGCVVAAVDAARVDAVTAAATREYAGHTGIHAQLITAHSPGGAHVDG